MRKTVGSLLACVALGACTPDPFVVVHDAAQAPRDGGVIPVDAASPPAIDAAVELQTVPMRTPSLGGGTLITLRGGASVFAASADLDRAYEISVPELAVLRTIDLPVASDAGRVVEDGAGRVHVVLRRAGSIATLPPGASEPSVRPVCAAPRGIAWRERDDMLVVACAEGVIMLLPAAGGAPVQTLAIGEDDLRDVVLFEERILVSRFRSAEVLAIDPDGSIGARYTPATVEHFDPLGASTSTETPTATLVPHVAWRMIPVAGGALLLHQRERLTAIPSSHEAAMGTVRGGYGLTSGPSLVVEVVVSTVNARAGTSTLGEGSVTDLALGTDLAVDEANAITVIATEDEDDRFGPSNVSVGRDGTFVTSAVPLGLTSVTTVGPTRVYLLRDPARILWVAPSTVGFPDTRMRTLDGRIASDGGHRAFHTITQSGLACASCHPEGGDDGHRWQFGIDAASVRTQSLVGGVMSSAPFHWEGDLASFPALLDEVFTGRMGGNAFRVDGDELAQWLDGLEPTPRPTGDAAAIARGQALFESTDVGCADCHLGEDYSDETTADVGTGGFFQVPRLTAVASRAPFLHTGCAATLRERFTNDAACTGGDLHGHTSELTPAQIDDLVAYLGSL